MKTGGLGIDSSRIESMMAQLKAAATKPSAPIPAVAGEAAAAKVDFSAALKGALDGVAAAQDKAAGLGKRFQMGDDTVNLSDMMISMQKASISFQATMQVRNKLVSAYQEMMNMQV